LAVLDADPAGHATAVGEMGLPPFPVMPQLLEEVEAQAVAAWTKAVRAADADFVVIDAPGALGAIVDLALIPVGASMLDIRDAAETVGIVRRRRKAGGRCRAEFGP
jgi:chromosome partitioning protein